MTTPSPADLDKAQKCLMLSNDPDVIERQICVALAKARAEEAEKAKEVIEDLICQFAYYVQGGGYTTGGLSALEGAFDYLGWKDPHPRPEIKCQFDKECQERGNCGTPYKNGYVHVCGKHFSFIQDEESARHPKT